SIRSTRRTRTRASASTFSPRRSPSPASPLRRPTIGASATGTRTCSTARGSKVVMGGLHVLSCPEECAPHADALALGDGVQLWPRILRDVEAGRLQPRYSAAYDNDYRDDPAPRREILPRRSFLTTSSLIATRGCHNRCGFCYLATNGLRMPYRMRDPAQ